MNVSGLAYRLGQFVTPASSAISDVCRVHSQHYIHGISQGLPWAVAMLDASAKPLAGLLQGNIHSLGYFEQCISVKPNANFSAQHCVATLNLQDQPATTPIEEMLKIKGMLWGLCLPSTCSSSDVRTALDEWVKDWHMKAIHVDCDDSLYHPMDIVDWLAVFILVILGLLILIGTGKDAYWMYRRRHYSTRWSRYSYFQRGGFLNSFSALNNGYFLCKKSKSSSMSSLNSIRFFSICWVVFGHVFLTVENLPAINYLEVKELMGSWTMMPIVSAPLAVDTFLLMSGLLVTHKFLKLMPENMSCQKLSLAALVMIVHRYLRIAPGLAMLILLQVSLWRHAGAGPLWVGGNSYLVELCEQNWYWALVFVQNYVAGDRLCLTHSWYLNVDMQLFLLSPLVIIPLLFFRESICILMLGCLIVSGFVSSFLVNYLNEFPAGLLVGDSGKWAAKSQHYYIVTHTRYAAYVIGIGVAYLLHKHKDQQLRNPLSWKPTTLLWVATGAALTYSVFGVLIFQSPDYEYEPISSSAFMAAAPIMWTLAVGWIVFSCETQQCGLISGILGKDMFQPMARLTYCIYLVHLPIMTMRANARRVPIYLSTENVIVEFFGDFALSTFFGLILYLTVEGPFTKFGYMISNRLKDRWAFEEELRGTSTSMEMSNTPPATPRKQYGAITSSLREAIA